MSKAPRMLARYSRAARNRHLHLHGRGRDYRPTRAAENKIRRPPDTMELAMQRTADVLATVAARADRPFVVGIRRRDRSGGADARTSS